MLAEGIALWLTDRGLVDYRPDDPGGDTFLGSLPQDVDDGVSIMDTPGSEPLSKLPVNRPSVQLRARGVPNDYVGPAQRLEALFSALHDLTNADLPNGVRVRWLRAAQSNPVHLGEDESNRSSFVQNYNAYTTAVTEHRPSLD